MPWMIEVFDLVTEELPVLPVPVVDALELLPVPGVVLSWRIDNAADVRLSHKVFQLFRMFSNM